MKYPTKETIINALGFIAFLATFIIEQDMMPEYVPQLLLVVAAIGYWTNTKPDGRTLE
jgi:hypothetical protein